jgi:hypothetical protein
MMSQKTELLPMRILSVIIDRKKQNQNALDLPLEAT